MLNDVKLEVLKNNIEEHGIFEQMEMLFENRNLINIYIHEKIERLKLRNEAQDDERGA